jgi:hypothetical protein
MIGSPPPTVIPADAQICLPASPHPWRADPGAGHSHHGPFSLNKKMVRTVSIQLSGCRTMSKWARAGWFGSSAGVNSVIRLFFTAKTASDSM